MSPQYRQSSSEIDYKDCNRYENISARGPCMEILFYDSHNFLFEFLGNRTAVRLTDRNRLHDYINANEINVIYKNYSIRFYFNILEL